MNKKQRSLRLLLHCEDASVPYLTPYFLKEHFSPEKKLIKDHLSLGIQLRDGSVVPTYERKVKSVRKKKKKKTSESSNDGSSDSKVLSENTKISNEKKDQGQNLFNNSKPTGYTFVGRSLPSHFCIPDGHHIISVPAFDIIDQYKFPNSKKNKKKGKLNVAIPSSTPKELILRTQNGYQKINCNLFVNVIQGLSAKYISHVALYDQATNATNNGSSNWKKKNMQSIERTKSWTDNCLEKSDSLRIWIPIVGGDDLQSRKSAMEGALSSISHSNMNENVEGIAFIGWHHIESKEIRANVLQSCLSMMKPKFNTLQSVVLATQGLEQIMEAALAGVNIIGSNLPKLLAKSSKALSLDLYGWRANSEEDKRELGKKFSLPNTSSDKHNSWKITRTDSGKHTKIESSSNCVTTMGVLDLNEKRYATDTSPLLRGCNCFSCYNGQHTRAYIHHLVNSRELLAEILLFIHNLYHILELMHELSDAIGMGKGELFYDYILKQMKI